jgi:hypothetical protein
MSSIRERLQEGRDRVVRELEENTPVLNICDVMDWIYWTWEKEPFSMPYEWESKKIEQFCKNFQLYLYEESRENFSPYVGADRVSRGRYKGVVLGDLS